METLDGTDVVPFDSLGPRRALGPVGGAFRGTEDDRKPPGVGGAIIWLLSPRYIGHVEEVPNRDERQSIKVISEVVAEG